MESLSHRTLKRLAAAFLRTEGCCAIGLEVRCPSSRYRADVAGYLDRVPYPDQVSEAGESLLWSTVSKDACSRRSRACEPRTIVIECKQSRSDFLKDDRKAEELIALREELRGWKTHVEENRIKEVEPELQRSDSSLFPDMEEWDFHESRLRSYRRLLARIHRVEEQLYGGAKFSLMSRYRIADHLYVAAPCGMIRKKEMPGGWGLIEFSRDSLASGCVTPDPPARESPSRGAPSGAAVLQESPPWRMAMRPCAIASPPERRARLLRNIAAAATRDAMRMMCDD